MISQLNPVTSADPPSSPRIVWSYGCINTPTRDLAGRRPLPAGCAGNGAARQLFPGELGGKKARMRTCYGVQFQSGSAEGYVGWAVHWQIRHLVKTAIRCSANDTSSVPVGTPYNAFVIDTQPVRSLSPAGKRKYSLKSDRPVL